MDVKPQMSLADAFKAELAVWGFSREEDARMIAFMACVNIRMEGKDPAVELGLTKRN